jgi:hypothetical protein
MIMTPNTSLSIMSGEATSERNPMLASRAGNGKAEFSMLGSYTSLPCKQRRSAFSSTSMRACSTMPMLRARSAPRSPTLLTVSTSGSA